MDLPALHDTIVAVSTGQQASPAGVVRLTGPDAHRLARSLSFDTSAPRGESQKSFGVSADASRSPQFDDVRLRLPDWGGDIAARRALFFSPASYTGQDVAELFVPGSPPLLTLICETLTGMGARPALAGEFTARAFRCGRMSSDQVDAVRALLAASDRRQMEIAARQVSFSGGDPASDFREELSRLIAALEAGIDFADEEDIRFITDAELAARIATLLDRMEPLARQDAGSRRRSLPHVLLAGRPNAGKSTLFNALIGGPRAIASDIAGTTTDVLSAVLTIDGGDVVLQDSAGVVAPGDAKAGHPSGPVDEPAAAMTAAALEGAGLVLWVHDRTREWTAADDRAIGAIHRDRFRIVLSKGDLPGPSWSGTTSTGNRPPIEASRCDVATVRAAIGAWLQEQQGGVEVRPAATPYRSAAECLRRAHVLCGGFGDEPAGGARYSSELVALELRLAADALTQISPTQALVEEVLGRIFSQFCIGK